MGIENYTRATRGGIYALIGLPVCVSLVADPSKRCIEDLLDHAFVKVAMYLDEGFPG